MKGNKLNFWWGLPVALIFICFLKVYCNFELFILRNNKSSFPSQSKKTCKNYMSISPLVGRKTALPPKSIISFYQIFSMETE